MNTRQKKLCDFNEIWNETELNVIGEIYINICVLYTFFFFDEKNSEKKWKKNLFYE